jgi:group I intron endonuclease
MKNLNSTVLYGHIYKITSPSGLIYIGKSINVKERFKKYKNGNVKTQIKICRSIQKYGWISHTWEVIDSANSKQELSNLEIFYINKYNSFKRGLNCSFGGEGVGKGNVPYNKNKKGLFRHTCETKQKISNSLTGTIRSDLSKIKYRESKLGEKNPMFKKSQSEVTKHLKSLNHARSKKIKNIVTEEVFNSIKDAAESINMNVNTLRYKLTLAKYNQTNLRFYEGTE